MLLCAAKQKTEIHFVNYCEEINVFLYT